LGAAAPLDPDFFCMMKSVYSFDDYRDFLKHHYFESKKNKSAFSYKEFSKAAKIQSPNYFKLVMDGDRNLTINNIHQFANAMALSAGERIYFEALVLFNQSDNLEQKRYYKSKLFNIRKDKPKRHLKMAGSQVISRWYTLAILFRLAKKTPSAPLENEIASWLKISCEEVRAAIAIFLLEEMISVKDNKYVLNQDYWMFEDKNSRSQMHQIYIEEQIKRSVVALKTKYASGAKFYSHTFTISAEGLEKYVTQVQALLEKIIATSDQEELDEVAQINIQLFKV
jgi:uncharacterized protein (TIGR02147 family)